MKTKEQIQSDIDSMVKSIDKHTPGRIYKRVSKQIRIRRELLIYIEQEPKEDIVKKHLKDANAKLKIIDNGFSVWLNDTADCEKSKNPISQYRGIMKRKSLTEQILNLKYLLA